MSDPFNCPKCGSHDYGLFAASMQGCPHCMRADLSAANVRIAVLEGALQKIATATGGNVIPFANKWARGVAEDALERVKP